MSKCDAFAISLDTLVAAGLDIAAMKFCYVDIKSETSVEEVFAYYSSTISKLKARYPSVTFVHITVPVTMRSVWWKRTARQLLGKDDPWDLASLKRERFNEMLRGKYSNEPFFDLAKLESTYPSGEVNTFIYEGEKASSLVPDYTDDGGHLNVTGRLVVSRQFLQVLADVSRLRRTPTISSE
jgi:hypothetical protein